MGIKGAIRGIGTALTYAGQQGMEEQRQARRDAVIAEREEALIKLRAQLGEQSADADLGRKKELDTYTTNNDIRATGAKVAIAEPAQVRAEDRAEGRDVRQAHLKAKIDWELYDKKLSAEERSKIRLMEAEARAEGDSFDGSPIKDDESGTYVRLTKAGKVYDTGVKFVRTASDDDDDSILGGRSSTTAPAAPSTQRTAKPGSIIRDKDGRRMRMNDAGKWVPMG